MISPETFGWIMEVVPSRSYKLDVRPYQIDLEDVKKTIQYLREHHEKYYTLYRLMLEGGLRLSHTLHVLKTFSPNEVVEIPEVGLVTRRLMCFEERGFCRYYVGVRGSQKPCEWAYFSVEILRLLRKYAGAKVDRKDLWEYVNRHDLIRPKYLRKVNWRILTQVIADKDSARFIQSRLGELKVSEARYGDLLSKADEHYPKYLRLLAQLGIPKTGP